MDLTATLATKSVQSLYRVSPEGTTDATVIRNKRVEGVRGCVTAKRIGVDENKSHLSQNFRPASVTTTSTQRCCFPITRKADGKAVESVRVAIGAGRVAEKGGVVAGLIGDGSTRAGLENADSGVVCSYDFIMKRSRNCKTNQRRFYRLLEVFNGLLTDC